MRNKYSKEFENWLKDYATTHTREQIIKKANSKFGYDIGLNALRKYLYRHNIKDLEYNKNKANSSNAKSIGSEWYRNDGMVLVKEANGKWDYKQRVVYKQHYGEIPKNHFVIFLDGDRTNYDINNLKLVSNRVASVVANQGLFTKDKNLTETSLINGELIVKIKELKGIKTTNHHKRRLI